MFRHYSGAVRVEWYTKIASTAFSNGDLVYADGSGAIQPADATSGDHIGIIQKDIASTDSDYASNTEVPVLVPTEDTLWVVDVDTGAALTTAMVGNRYDLTDANSLNVGGTSKKVVTIVRYISATKAIVKINAMISAADVATT